MFLGNAKKIIAWAVTIAYGGYLVITTAREVKAIIDDVKEYKRLKQIYQKKDGEEYIESYFVD